MTDQELAELKPGDRVAVRSGRAPDYTLYTVRRLTAAHIVMMNDYGQESRAWRKDGAMIGNHYRQIVSANEPAVLHYRARSALDQVVAEVERLGRGSALGIPARRDIAAVSAKLDDIAKVVEAAREKVAALRNLIREQEGSLP